MFINPAWLHNCQHLLFQIKKEMCCSLFALTMVCYVWISCNSISASCSFHWCAVLRHRANLLSRLSMQFNRTTTFHWREEMLNPRESFHPFACMDLWRCWRCRWKAARRLKKTFMGLTEIEIVHNWEQLNIRVMVFDAIHSLSFKYIFTLRKC